MNTIFYDICRYFVVVVLLLPQCSFNKHNETLKPEETVIDLTLSTNLIRKAIEQNTLGELVQDASPQDITRFINNLSPAQLAFEAEILGKEIPGIIMFYEDSASYAVLRSVFEQSAQQHKNQAIFATIDANELYSLAQSAQIEHFPAIIIVYNHEEVGRLEGINSNTALKEVLEGYIVPFLQVKEQ